MFFPILSTLANMEYQNIIDGILQCSELVHAIDEMCKRTSALNLVRSDWSQYLMESPLYHSYKEGKINFSSGNQKDAVTVKNVVGMQNCYNVIVAGYWSLKTYDPKKSSDTTEGGVNSKASVSIVSRLCLPVIEIGNNMKEDKRTLSDNCGFFVDRCGSKCCAACKKAMKNYSLDFQLLNDWCILKTKIFDGENIKHIFKTSLLDAFHTGNFLGILNLRIQNVILFGKENFKIGGSCKEMILFKESSLHQPIDINIEDPFENSNICDRLPISYLPTTPTIHEVDEGIPEKAECK